MAKSANIGAARALLAAALFGASTPIAKALVADVAPQLLAGLFYVGSGIGLAVFLLARPSAKRAESEIGRAGAGWLAGSIVAGGIAAPILLLAGLARTPSSSAALYLNFEAVFTALVAWIVFRENFDRRIALGMAFIVAGGLALGVQGTPSWEGLAGPLLIAAACLCWALDNNLTQKISMADPVRIATIKGLVAGGVNIALALLLGQHWPSASRAAAALGIGVVSYGMSLALYTGALRTLGTARTGAYFSTAPFAGAILGLLLWHDPVTAPLIFASIAMAAGVAIHLRESHSHLHLHEPLEHEHPHYPDIHHRHDQR